MFIAFVKCGIWWILTLKLIKLSVVRTRDHGSAKRSEYVRLWLPNLFYVFCIYIFKWSKVQSFWYIAGSAGHNTVCVTKWLSGCATSLNIRNLYFTSAASIWDLEGICISHHFDCTSVGKHWLRRSPVGKNYTMGKHFILLHDCFRLLIYTHVWASFVIKVLGSNTKIASKLYWALLFAVRDCLTST